MGIYENIFESIKESNQLGPVEYLSDLQGYSGKKLIGTLQRLAQKTLNQETCYLEIGVYRGLTLTSVGKVIDEAIQVYGIDNFALFDKDGKNQETILDSLKRHGVKNARLINEDYEDALHNLSKYIGNKKVGLYFIDGPHDYRSQLMCLEFARKHLAENAIILIDDSNYEHVRQANSDFLLSHPEFKLIYENYTECHPENMTNKATAKEGWWNGINIIIHDPLNQLETKLPATNRSRTTFENEHMIHTTRNALLAPYIHYMFQSFVTFRIKHFVHALIHYRRQKKMLRKNELLKENTYLLSNTFSKGLIEWINPSIVT